MASPTPRLLAKSYQLSQSFEAALIAIACTGIGAVVAYDAHGQELPIVPDRTTATQVINNQILPSSPESLRGGNLFHSFSQFNVPATGVVFAAGGGVNGAAVNNIINRVTGANASEILGTIQSRVAFPNANLFLINPNGLIFGSQARLDIGGSFHASTATGIGFSQDRVFGVDSGDLPSGNPTSFIFRAEQPAALLNQADLTVSLGQNISLTGGTVYSSGILSAPNGTVAIATVEGGSKVELRSTDAILSLEVNAAALKPDWQGKITQITQLAKQLTGATPLSEADKVVVNPDGSLSFSAQPPAFSTFKIVNNQYQTLGNFPLDQGDLVLGSANSGTVQISSAANVTLIKPQLATTGNLSITAKQQLIYRDTPEVPANISTAGNILLVADQGIDLLALNHADGLVKVNGVINLVSDGKILVDFNFAPASLLSNNAVNSTVNNTDNLFSTNLLGEPATTLFNSRR